MTSYGEDIVAWANEQATLLRTGRFDLLDIEHVADEIEDVGKSEQRDFARRMATLLAGLLKWQHRCELPGKAWEALIELQRTAVLRRLNRTPSLRPMLTDPDWQDEMWADAVCVAHQETGLDVFPDHCLWSLENEVLADGWLPQ